MKISIVIPSHNGAAFLPATLDSVRAQTIADWELVVVDDASVDESHAIAQTYAARDPRIRALRRPCGSAAAARNAGCAELDSRSDYVAFLDHDDVWHDDALEGLVRQLEADPDSVAAHGLARGIDRDGKSTGSILNYDRRKVASSAGAYKISECARNEPTTFQTLVCDCCLPTPGVALVRRSAFNAVELTDGTFFDTDMASGCDWDLWLRLSLLGNLAYVDEVILDWRSHDSNESRDSSLMFRAEALVRRKFCGLPDLDAEQRAMAQWRCRRSFASVERRNAGLAARAAWTAVAGARFGPASRLARLWVEHYRSYLALRRSTGPIDTVPQPLGRADIDLEHAGVGSV